MAGAQAQELLMLFGGMAVCTLLTQFLVAGAARPSGAQDSTRDMIRTVLEMDPSDPDATRRLKSVPELHELASMIAAEKSSKIEALQEVQAQRRELVGLLKGMERSAVSGDPLREEQGSEICNQVARAWNSLLASAASGSVAQTGASAPVMSGPGSPEPGMLDLSASLAALPERDASAVSERVDRIEESLEALQRMVQQLSNASPASPVITTALPFDSDPVPSDALFAPEPVAPHSVAPTIEQHRPADDVGLGVDAELDDDSEATGSPSSFHEWSGALSSLQAEPPTTPAEPFPAEPSPATSSTQAFESMPGLERSGIATPPRLPGMGDELPMTHGAPTPSAADPQKAFEPTVASAPALDDPSVTPGAATEASAASSIVPSFGVSPPPTAVPESSTDSVSFGAAPEPASAAPAFPVPGAPVPNPGLSQPAVPPSTERASAPSPSQFPVAGDADVDREFARHFPHFIGQPVSDGEQVEVTYDTDAAPVSPAAAPQIPSAPAPSVARRPQTPRSQAPAPQREPEMASSAPPIAPNPRQFPESEVIDLRSLGAVEFED